MNEYKIVKDKTFLQIPTKKCESIEEGNRIGNHLKNALNQFGGIGLAANQLGYNKRVCLIHAIKTKPPLILINPIITKASVEKLIFYESCLSIPNNHGYTIRNKYVIVTADNVENEIEFKPTILLADADYKAGLHLKEKDVDEGLLETICVQHEINHLDGILITDPTVRFIPKPPKKIKIGRNDKVIIKNKKTNETRFIKYKNTEELLTQGWEVV